MILRRVILFLGEARLEALVKAPNRSRLIRIQYDWKEKVQTSTPPKNWIVTVLHEAKEVAAGGAPAGLTG
jgi:hypothetical protein